MNREIREELRECRQLIKSLKRWLFFKRIEYFLKDMIFSAADRLDDAIVNRIFKVMK